MSGSKPKRIKGCCGVCGHFKVNGKKNDAVVRAMRKLGQKRRFTRTQDGW